MSTSIVTSASLVKSPARPKPPRPNPRRKLIDPANVCQEEQAAFLAILVNSKLNARGWEIIQTVRFLQEIMVDARERAGGLLYADIRAAGFCPASADIGTLDYMDVDIAGFEWVLEQFVQAMMNDVIPRSREDLEKFHGDVTDSPFRKRQTASAGKRVPK